MFYSIDQYLGVLEEFQITAHQFLLPYLLCLHHGHQMPMIAAVVKRQTSIGDMNTPMDMIVRCNVLANPISGDVAWTQADIHNLMVAKALQKMPLNTPLADLLPTTTFRNVVFTHTGDFEEFFKLYPMLMSSSTSEKGFPTKGSGINVMDLEVLYRKVVTTRSEHERVMRCLQWGIDHKMIQYKIDTFLNARVWWDLEKAMAEAQVHPEGHTRTKSGNTATSITF